MRPLLPEICWNQVEDWEIEWVEMRAKLLQQPQIDPETTKSQSEQEITAILAEIQAEIGEDQEIKHKTAHQQFSKNEPEEEAEISDQEDFQTIHIHTNSSSQLQVEGEAGALQNATAITDQYPNPKPAEQQLISQLNSKKNRSEFQSITKPTGNRQDKENKAQLYEPGIVDGDVTSGFEPASAGEWSELAGVVVLQRPPPEPPDLDPLVEITDARRRRSLDNDGCQDVRSRGAEYAEYDVINEEKRRKTVEDGSTTVTGGVSDYAGVLHGSAVAKGDRQQRATNRHVLAALSSGGGIHRGWIRRASSIAAKPPSLLAAVLPWNCSSEGIAIRQGKQERRLEEKVPMMRHESFKGGSDLKPHTVALGEPATAAFMTEATPHWANGVMDVASVWFSSVWSKFHSWFEGEAENEERKSMAVLLSKQTNEDVHERPLLSRVGQWQAQTYPSEVSNIFLSNRPQFSWNFF
ncbi:hypothetical protein PIB30_044741 [Stylosanthes scabra]|uniref:Uncharacterized protein n=1 Tax=Stylosanthes scabra TaxID=79078 RepID=A0ABU6YDC0_9FABA|nr:hypothetical protein [Stylosanthes scabra]